MRDEVMSIRTENSYERKQKVQDGIQTSRKNCGSGLYAGNAECEVGIQPGCVLAFRYKGSIW